MGLSTTPPLTIPLPQHSSKSWNNLFITSESSKISVYLNTALIRVEEYTSLAPFNVKDDIIFGSGVDEQTGEMTGPFLDGGIADLFYGGSYSKDKLPKFEKNLLKLHDPHCRPFLDLPFDLPDPYRDDGCMRFDPMPVVQQLFIEEVVAKTGQYYPLVSFGPHQIASAKMAELVTADKGAEIVVPSFPAIFREDVPTKYGMMFRFRPTSKADKDAGRHTFAHSRLKDTPDDAANPYAIRVGTLWDDDDQFRFFLQLATTAEAKTVESILHSNFPGSEFCGDCVWNVVVNWDAAENGGGVDNVQIYNAFRGEMRKTSYSTLRRCRRWSSASTECIKSDARDSGTEANSRKSKLRIFCSKEKHQRVLRRRRRRRRCQRQRFRKDG